MVNMETEITGWNEWDGERQNC